MSLRRVVASKPFVRFAVLSALSLASAAIAQSSADQGAVVNDIASISSLVPQPVANRVMSLSSVASTIGVSNPEESIFVLVNPALRGEEIETGTKSDAAAETAEALLFPDSQKLPETITSSIRDGTFAKWLGDIAGVAVGHLLRFDNSAASVSSIDKLIGKAKAAPKESKLRYVFTFDAACSDPKGGELVLRLVVRLHRFELEPDPSDPDRLVIAKTQLMFADSATGKSRLEGGESPSIDQLHVAVKTAFIDAMRNRIALSIVNDLLDGRWNAPIAPDAPRGRQASSPGAKTGDRR